MSSLKDLKTVELFDRLINDFYWLLFFPHNSYPDFTIENYTQHTNTYFPDLLPIFKDAENLLKEIILTVQSERPDLFTDCARAMSALKELVINKKASTDVVPVFVFYRQLVGLECSDRKPQHSRLLQVLSSYGNSFEGDLEPYIPNGLGSHNYNSAWSCLEPVTVTASSENLPPFWRWFNNIVIPQIRTTNHEKVGLILRNIFAGIAFPFIPKDLNDHLIILPLPNFTKLWTMLNYILPEEDKDGGSAIRLYSALQFVTFGINDVSILGKEYCSVDTGLINFKDYLTGRADAEAERISRYNIIDMNKAQITGALESFRLSELEAIKRTYTPDEDDDSSLDPDTHNPDDDRNLDPDIDRTGDYSRSNISKEDNDDSQDTAEDDAIPDDTDSDKSGNDSDGGDLGGDGLDESSGLGDNSISPVDPSNDPNSTEVKEVSSKNKTSNKAYKKMWGGSPFELANDNDPEGYFYRNNVLVLDKLLQEDPGDAIPRSTKNALHDWCRLWIHCADVRFTIKLINYLKLSSYLKV